MSHYKPYPAYKDSGVEWLGRVPEHWGICSFKRVASICYGIGEPPGYKPEGTPLIRATNVDAGKIRNEGLVYVDPAEIPERRAVWLAPGDIIVVRSGAYTGDSAIVRQEHCPSIAGFDMVIRAHDVDPDFLQYALLSNYLKSNQIDLEKMRAAQPHLNAEELGACFVLLPSGLEQKRIVVHLDHETARIDALIEKKTRFIELLREKRQALITHAVTKGLDPNVKMKDSGVEWLGEVPEHWKLTPLKRLVSSIGQGWSPECESRPPDENEWGVVKVGCVNGGVFRPDESKALPAEMEPRPELGLKKGDVLVSRANTRELVGSCAVVPDDYPQLLLCDKLYRIGCGADVTPEFLAALIAVYGRRAVEIEATGASSSMVNIAQSVILDLVVAAPGKQEQDEIINRISTATERIDSLGSKTERSIELLKERRSALITAAVTGQIDLRESA